MGDKLEFIMKNINIFFIIFIIFSIKLNFSFSEVICYSCNSLTNDFCQDEFTKSSFVNTCKGVACFKRKTVYGSYVQDVIRGCKQKLRGKENVCRSTSIPYNDLIRRIQPYDCICKTDRCNKSTQLAFNSVILLIIFNIYKLIN